MDSKWKLAEYRKPQTGPLCHYDIIVDITKIADVEKGWPMILSPELEEKAIKQIKTGNDQAGLEQLSLNNSDTVVAVLGLFNKGKTHIVNHLAGVNLASDRKIHTKGLSFLGSKKDGYNIMFLDTAGTNAPLERCSTNDPDALAQKKTTEMFLQEMAFSLADVMVVVVNEITWPDQEFLKVLQKKLAESEKDYKQLFVIHNFVDVKTETDYLIMWRKWVVSTFEGELKKQNTSEDKQVFFLKEESPVITLHFCLAYEEAPVGKFWNPKVYETINQMINSRTVKKKVNFTQLLTERTLEALRIYCNNPDKVEIIPTRAEKPQVQNPPSDVDDKIKHNIDEFIKDVKLQEAVVDPGIFKLKASGELQLKADKVNFDGFRILLTKKRNEFDPKYDILDTETGYEIVVDLPGIGLKSEEEVKPGEETKQNESNEERSKYIGGDLYYEIDVKEETSILKIYGERKLTFYDLQKEQYSYYAADQVIKSSEEPGENRQQSKFQISINLPRTVSDSIDEALVDLRDGLFCIVLPKKQKQKKPKVYDKKK